MIFIYLVSIVSGILAGITESINKNITEEKYSVFSYVFIQLLGTLIIFTIPFLLYGKLSSEPIAYLYIAIIVILIFLGNSAIIKSYKTEDISNTNILSRSSLVITFFSGIFLLKEKVSIFNMLGVLSIILGIFAIFYERKSNKKSKGFFFALASGVFFGMVAYFIKLTLNYFDLYSYIFIYSIFSVCVLSVVPNTFRDIKPIFIKYKKKIILTRILAALVIVLYVSSIERGIISIVNTNFETAFLLSTSLIGIGILGEKKNLVKKLTGAILCILGIILLNFF